jgi:hypothetical protein
MEFVQLTLIRLSVNTFGTANTRKLRARHPWNYICIRNREKRLFFKASRPDKAHAASNSMGTKISFLGGKAASVKLSR